MFAHLDGFINSQGNLAETRKRTSSSLMERSLHDVSLPIAKTALIEKVLTPNEGQDHVNWKASIRGHSATRKEERQVWPNCEIHFSIQQ